MDWGNTVFGQFLLDAGPPKLPADMDISTAYRVWLKAQIESAGISVPDLAERAGTRKQTIYMFLAGETDFPRANTRQSWERALGRKFTPETVGAVAGQDQTKHVQLDVQDSSRLAPAIDLRALEQIPLDLEGAAFMEAVERKRYRYVPVDSDAEHVLSIRLHEDLGGFKATQVLTVQLGLEPEEGEHVFVQAKGRRQLGTWSLDDDRKPSVSLWSGGITREFRLIGTVISVTQSTLKRPR